MATIKTTTLIGVVAVLAVIAAGLFLLFPMAQQQEPTVNNFDECAAAGYPVMEKYPEECTTPDGRTFVKDVLSSGNDIVANGCVVAGCSSQLCISEEDAADGVVSTCEWNAEYICYQNATCGRQANGNCG